MQQGWMFFVIGLMMAVVQGGYVRHLPEHKIKPTAVMVSTWYLHAQVLESCILHFPYIYIFLFLFLHSELTLCGTNKQRNPVTVSVIEQFCIVL